MAGPSTHDTTRALEETEPGDSGTPRAHASEPPSTEPLPRGTAVGRYTAQLVMGTNQNIEPRFSLQSKAAQQRRDVH